MGIDNWSSNEEQNTALGKYDVSRGETPDASTSEHARVLMAEIKALSESVDERFENFVGENIEVDGVTIVNNDGTLTVTDVAIDGDTEDLLTAKIEEIEAAATQAGEDATAAQTAATQAAASAASVETSVTAAATAANVAAEQADIAARAAARAQSGAAMAESAVQAVMAQTNLNWQKTEKAVSVSCYPVPETVLEPVIDFLFVETEPDSDTKGPDNPSTITGVSSITVTRCETAGVDSTDYVISLGNTYYGGSIDLATGLMTVTHGLLFLNSSQNWSYTTQEKEGLYRYQYRFGFPKDGGSDGRGDICSHFIYSVAPGEDAIVSWHHSKTYLYIKTSLSTVDDLKTWFTSQTNNNTPVCVAYELTTPYTVQLSPLALAALAQTSRHEPRLNTIYTDAQAVQVGYAKSPIRSEYELTQAIIATEGGE